MNQLHITVLYDSLYTGQVFNNTFDELLDVVRGYTSAFPFSACKALVYTTVLSRRVYAIRVYTIVVTATGYVF